MPVAPSIGGSGRGAAAYALAAHFVRPAPVDTHAIREGGCALSARHPLTAFVTLGLLLSACSGSTTQPPSAAPTPAAPSPVVSIYLPAKGTIRTDGMCFDVLAPGSGSYKLTMHESRSKANGSMAFVVP